MNRSLHAADTAFEAVRHFSDQNRASNQDIVDEMPNSEKLSNSRSVPVFLNQTRPDNKKLIGQRSSQKRNRALYKKALNTPWQKNDILVSLSGLTKKQEREIARILIKEIGFIEDITYVDRVDGVVLYLFKLRKTNVVQLSEILDDYPIAGFQLSLIGYDDVGMDLTLK